MAPRKKKKLSNDTYRTGELLKQPKKKPTAKKNSVKKAAKKAGAKKIPKAKGKPAAKKTTAKKTTAKPKRDRYGISKTRRDGTKKTASNPGGSRSMKGKSGDTKFYLYNKRTGDYKIVTKAEVKKAEKNAGVGNKKTDSFRLVTKNTFERAQRHGAQSPTRSANSRGSAAQRKRTPRQLRNQAGKAGSRTRSTSRD